MRGADVCSINPVSWCNRTEDQAAIKLRNSAESQESFYYTPPTETLRSVGLFLRAFSFPLSGAFEVSAIAPYQSETNADNEGGAEAEVRLSVLDDGS
jgi:hypothetical protein